MEIQRYKEIDSTHKYVKENQSQYKQTTAIIANKQTSGIGTKGRNWFTGTDKNIAISIIYKPECEVKKLERITIKIAEILQKIIEDLYNIKLKIKEPNDLILNNKKICGILTESNISGDKVNYLIISIGFNVNETKFPKELDNIATSLKKETGKEFNKEDILQKIITNLENII